MDSASRHAWYNTRSLTEAEKKLITERWLKMYPNSRIALLNAKNQRKKD